MRSDIQKLKVYNLYQALDVQKNGYVEKADLDALAERLAHSQGRAQGSPQHAELQARLYAYWAQLIKSLDGNRDDRVSQEEFLQFGARLMKNPTSPESQSIEAISDVIFTLADHDGSGTISEREFVQCFRSYGISDAAATTGFRMVDQDGNGRITRAEWLAFMRDVFYSRELNDAAAVVFGPGSRSGG
jgi:Ca2+-binding EF-hand superfamily protein